MNEIQKLADQHKIRCIDVIMIAAGYDAEPGDPSPEEARAAIVREYGFISDSLLDDFAMIDPSPEDLD